MTTEETPEGRGSIFLTRGALQFVRPYEYAFQVAVKGRWVGRTATDVFRTEFPHYGAAYYDAAVDSGRISVQWEAHRKKGLGGGGDAPAGPLDPRQPLRLGHVLWHRLHRHELPVLAHAAPVKIVDYVPMGPLAHTGPTGTSSARPSTRPILRGVFVLDKPASVPVHPSGRYQRNTIQEFILAGDFVVSTDRAARAILAQAAANGHPSAAGSLNGSTTAVQAAAEAVVRAAMAWNGEVGGSSPGQSPASGMHTCHRLDKGTSGVLLVATDGEVARGMSDALSDKSDEAAHIANTRVNTAKTYLALVSGRVPRVTDDAAAPSAPQYVEPGEVLLINRAIYCKSARDGIFDCLTADQERARVMRSQTRSTAMGEEAGSSVAYDRLRRQREDTSSAKDRLKEKHARQTAATKLDKRGAATAAAAASTLVAAAELAAASPATAEGQLDDATATAAAAASVLVECAKWATTRVTVLKYDARRNETLVECEPFTGRTHQLRVHLARVLGCPIVGDDTYGWSCGDDAAGRAAHIRRFVETPSGSSSPIVPVDCHAVAAAANSGGGLVPDQDYATVPSCVECCLALQNQAERTQGGSATAKLANPPAEVQVKCSDDRLVMEGSSLLCLHALRYQIDLGACSVRVAGHAAGDTAATSFAVETPKPLWAEV
jgi:23S rRNA-/tRNA-specific pseudouridylate synthase